MYICDYVCICVCDCLCIMCMYVHKYVCDYVCICVCDYLCMCVCDCLCICVHDCLYVCLHVTACASMYVHVCKEGKYTHTTLKHTLNMLKACTYSVPFNMCAHEYTVCGSCLCAFVGEHILSKDSIALQKSIEVRRFSRTSLVRTLLMSNTWLESTRT